MHPSGRHDSEHDKTSQSTQTKRKTLSRKHFRMVFSTLSIFFSIFSFIITILISWDLLPSTDPVPRFLLVELDFLLGMLTLSMTLYSLNEEPKATSSNFIVNAIKGFLILLLLVFTFISIIYNFTPLSKAAVFISAFTFFMIVIHLNLSRA
jgi:hypothetical protein